MKRAAILLMVLQVPVDFVLLLCAGATAYGLRFSSLVTSRRPVIFDITFAEFISIAFTVALIWLIIFALFRLYSPDPNRRLMSDLHRVFFACSAGLAVIALYVFFTQDVFQSRFLALFGWLFAILYVAAGRILVRGIKGMLYRSGVGVRRVAVVGDKQVADEIVSALNARKALGYNVVGQYDAWNAATKKAVREIGPDEIILTNPRAKESETIDAIEFCNRQHIVFKYSADLFDAFSTNMSIHPLAGIPIVELKRTSLEGWGRVVKRLFDIVLSILILILTSPLLLIVALVILIETGRPVFYKNERVGIRGKRFWVYKFRSMHQKDSTGPEFGGTAAQKREKALIEKQNARKGPIYKIKDDPRVTRFGRIIRRFSIDELPQFFNVLGGSMSIVGPRPHQPREVEQYIEKHAHVFTLKPGITGLAQISGRSDLQFDEEMRLDVYYIEKWSVLLDCVIFVKTPFILFKKRDVA